MRPSSVVPACTCKSEGESEGERAIPAMLLQHLVVDCLLERLEEDRVVVKAFL